MSADASAPVARRGFACASCEREAGLVQLLTDADAARIVRDSFTSRLTWRLAPEQAERLREVIMKGDIQALYEFNPEVAAFYCPDCRACYCGEHWTSWDVFDDEEGFLWHDSIRGRCPRGHERMLED